MSAAMELGTVRPSRACAASAREAASAVVRAMEGRIIVSYIGEYIAL